MIGTRRAELTVFEIGKGRAVGQPIILSDEVLSTTPGYVPSRVDPAGQFSFLRAAPGVVVATVGTELYVVSSATVAAAAGELRAPVHFPLPAAPAPVITGTSVIGPPVLIPIRAEGGAPPLEFSLGFEIPGLTIHPALGQVSADAHALTAMALEALHAGLRIEYHAVVGAAAPPAHATPEEAVDAYIAAAAPTFERFTGRRPAGVPVAIFDTIVVRDKDQQAGVLPQTFFMEIPSDEVKQFITKREAEWAALLQRSRPALASPPVPPAQAAGAGKAAEDAEALRQRMAELERQNVQLQSKLELLTDILRKGAATRPTTSPAIGANEAPTTRPR